MKGFPTKRWAAAFAAAGAGLALAGPASAQAQRPPSLGAGAPTGQISVQLFSFSRYVNSGEGELNPPSPATPLERLDRVLQFLQSKGVKNAELYAAGFPAGYFPDTNPNTPVNYDGLRAIRALGDKYGIRFPTRGGSVNESTWDDEIAAAKILGQQAIGTGALPGIGSSTYASLLAQAELINRLGKRSVEAGVGPLHFHNHEAEFQRKFMDGGKLKTAWEILLDHTDPRYVTTVLDLFWVTASQEVDVLDLISLYRDRIIGFHVKDGLNPNPATPNSDLRPVGQGHVNFGPIFELARNNVRYYTYEYDPVANGLNGFNQFTAAEQSIAAMKGDPAPAIQSEAPSFAATAAGATSAAVPVTISNFGDAPLSVNAVSVAAYAEDGGNQTRDEFQVVSQTCTAGPVAPSGSCTVNVAFRPSRTNSTSVARLQITSNADDATETVRLAARSTGDAVTGVGGVVPSTLSLSLANATASFGSFAPGVGRAYEATLSAIVTTTSGDATLSVVDPSTVAPGHLVNGSFSLPQAVEAKASNAANASPAFAPVGASPAPLLTWSGPVSGDAVTLGFRQQIGAGDALRTGNYGKSLTFTLSTTQP